jgi:hypothetical protein
VIGKNTGAREQMTMAHKNKNTVLALCLCVGALVHFVAACDEENDASDDKTKHSNIDSTKYKGMGPYAVLSYVGDSTFLGVLDSLTWGDYTVKETHEVASQSFTHHDGKVYVFPYPYGGETDIEIYRVTAEGGLEWESALSTPAGAVPSDMLFVSDERAYLSLSEAGLVWEVDLDTLEEIAEIDLTEYAVDDGDSDTPTDNSPNPSNLAVKDGKLYVTLSQSYNEMKMGRDGMYVAVIDMETNTVEEVIEDLDRGFSYAGRFSATGNATFLDENGDLYVSAVGSWGWVDGQKAGFLRINAGETEFDPDWEIDFSDYDLSIDGETVKTDYLHFSVYAGDGIVYGSGHIPAHESNPPEWVTDRNYSLVKVDLYNQTIETLPLPATTAYASDMTMDGDLLVAPLFTGAGAGVYVYDPATGDAVTEPVIQTEGTMGGIRKID